MFRVLTAFAGLAIMLLVVSTLPAVAHDANGIVTVRLRHVERPGSASEAERLLDRIEAAQEEACGASAFSLHEYRRAVRRGACWREGVVRTVDALANPLLSEALANRRPRRS